MTGYVRSYRSKWDHPIFRNKQEAAVWAWMCDTAQWRDGRISTKFGPINLYEGEILIAERELAADFGMHRNTLRSLLQRMTDDGMIESRRDGVPHRAGTVLVVKNYKKYQRCAVSLDDEMDRSRDRRRTEEGPDGDQNGTKNNKVKEEEDITLANAKVLSLPDPSPDMIRIWSEVCGDLLPVPRKADSARVKALKARFADTFHRDLEEWRAYCGQIRGTPFCCGENDRGWRADLDWALKPATINKVLEGKYQHVKRHHNSDSQSAHDNLLAGFGQAVARWSAG
jgi:DNA-binding transcriptional ArsR family regulator